MDIQFLISRPVLAIAADFVKARLRTLGVPIIDRGLPPVEAVPAIEKAPDAMGACNCHGIRIVIPSTRCGMNEIVTLCHELAHWYDLTPNPANLAARNAALSRGEQWAREEYSCDPQEVTARDVGRHCCHQVAAAIAPMRIRRLEAEYAKVCHLTGRHTAARKRELIQEIRFLSAHSAHSQ